MSDLGAELRALRLAHELGTRSLAARAGVSRASVQRIESGERRARASMIRYLALALDPDGWQPIEARLIEAAGADLVVGGDGWWSYRSRRYQRSVAAGIAPLPRRIHDTLSRRRGELHVAGRTFYEPPADAARRLRS